MLVSTKVNIFWVTKVLNKNNVKIMSYSNLPAGWNHGEGEIISHDTISAALKFEKFAMSKFLVVDSVPGINGEIQLAVSSSKKNPGQYLEITISASNDINITKYALAHDSWDIEYDIDFDSLEKSFQQIICFKNELHTCLSILEYYQKSNFSHMSGDSGVAPLKTTKAEYQFFKSNALTSYPIRYASI